MGKFVHGKNVQKNPTSRDTFRVRLGDMKRRYEQVVE